MEHTLQISEMSHLANLAEYLCAAEAKGSAISGFGDHACFARTNHVIPSSTQQCY